MNIIIIIQIRLGSKRLPNKGILKINNITLIEILINRIKKCKNYYKLVIATSIDPINDIIEKISHDNNIECFRGDEEDVYSRFKAIADKYNIYDII